MSTQLDTELEHLEILFFAEDAQDGDGCETSKGSDGAPCSREAVFVIRWRADSRPAPEDRCACARLTHQCLAHGESYMGLEMTDVLIQCTRCQGFMAPINIDRIRRS